MTSFSCHGNLQFISTIILVYYTYTCADGDINMKTKSISLILEFTIFKSLLTIASSIDCFKCISINHDYKPCEDPFHNNYTADILHSPCMGGRKGRDGVFPATSCIKLSGVFDDSQDTILVRGCALDSGTLTTDTELVRSSHCGAFRYDDRYVRGCIQSCDDADACNDAMDLSGTTIFSLLWQATFLSFLLYF